MRTFFWLVLAAGTALAAARADDPEMSTEAPAVRFNPNVPLKTLGGRMLWSDVAFFHDWRIQRNVFTKHYRLLDGRDVRHAWGTLEQCQARLQEIRKEQNLPAMSGEAVVLVHGIARSSKSMRSLRKHLQSAGVQVFSFDYPSTQVPIEQAADDLERSIESLEGIERLQIVGFSLGGLVVRSYLHRHPHERVQRVLLIGTPNSGAELADTFHKLFLYKLVFGPAGQQLTRDTGGIAAQVPAPDVEFGVIAGARGSDAGFNPLIAGDDDGTVSLASARLSGAVDFLTVPALHPVLIHHPLTLEAAALFLAEGKFRAEGERQPIP